MIEKKWFLEQVTEQKNVKTSVFVLEKGKISDKTTKTVHLKNTKHKVKCLNGTTHPIQSLGAQMTNCNQHFSDQTPPRTKCHDVL